MTQDIAFRYQGFEVTFRGSGPDLSGEVHDSYGALVTAFNFNPSSSPEQLSFWLAAVPDPKEFERLLRIQDVVHKKGHPPALSIYTIMHDLPLHLHRYEPGTDWRGRLGGTTFTYVHSGRFGEQHVIETTLGPPAMLARLGQTLWPLVSAELDLEAS